MKKRMMVLLVIACSLLLSGCTSLSYHPTRGARYWSVLQKKSLTITYDDHGRLAGVAYTTDSDAAVELAKMNAQLAGQLAGKGL